MDVAGMVLQEAEAVVSRIISDQNPPINNIPAVPK